MATALDVTLQPLTLCVTELGDTVAFNLLLLSALEVFLTAWHYNNIRIIIITRNVGQCPT